MTATRFRDSARYWRTPLLPGADLLTAEYHDHAFTPHWHDAYTIPVIEDGAESFRYLGSEYVAEAGSVPVINPGELHTGSRAVDEGWRYRVMYAPIEFMHGLAADVAGRAQPLPWFGADVIRDLDLAHRLSRAHRLLEADADQRGGFRGIAADEAGMDSLAVEGALLDALSTLLVRYARTRPEPLRPIANDPRVETMKERLATDMTAPMRVADLADAVGLSPFHATRLFTQATGLPPHAWRTQVRLQRALGPLRAGALVADVAAATGFTDQSHFTRHFRRVFGVPPGRWQSS
ncbi:AraC family transcriptional regulator [Paraburkholderia caballeronis]|uniref:AraC-type DNA-binding protein n=1 Tax=Paraburkholderia caballeronis TaxID=416943 RepID=A0A1H7MIH0_9BURK|nr:AraC family transcriptional regulator [Paraburkholderia caballeronis]PXW26574.1 AraC family transcriptional regulator [Paraburkholderia caballeronis]PXX02121.1 AraC family transcriptional regulator [Paraburkholderia caballeronis]RAK01278.1 AraC family transcriptional regulator [Paraburkholderia caballeronis]TDV16157.1 AraC family transcriptional regulator [Paraburkholderia caballeronis]TDV20507.1 AraC family transcriptional regulator [Paraburkholderia caballeronis]